MWALTVTAIILVLALFAAWESRSRLIWWLEVGVNVLTGARRAGQNKMYLKEIYDPVRDEWHERDLPVEGVAPGDVNGVFLRIGPNPFYPPTGDYHLFDGDGMIHAVRLKGGKAAYSNHWVQTERLRQELKAGHPLFLKFGDMVGKRALLAMLFDWLKSKLGVMDSSHGRGTANTAMAFHSGRLLALHEGDMPYQVRVYNDGAQETISRVTFGESVPSPFTAHPKIHPLTGELVGFGWSTRPPFLHYFVLDPEGRCTSSFPIDLPAPVMMHDFAITQDYVIFLDFPLVFKPEAMFKGDGNAFVFDKKRGTRFGVMRRDAKSGKEVQWYEMESMFAFHVANAWQEGPVIRLFAAISEEKQLGRMKDDYWSNPDWHAFITEISINTDTGATSRQRVCDTVCEFPTVPSSLVGQPSRYTYVAEAGRVEGSNNAYFVGISKIDLRVGVPHKAVAGRILYGGQRVGGEPIFVPRKNPTGEDNGYLLTFVTDVKTGDSAFHVYNAATMAEKPVSRVPIPHRIPYGFHALHMTDVQLLQQLPLHLQLESLANVRVKMTSGCIGPVRVGFAEEAWRPQKAA